MLKKRTSIWFFLVILFLSFNLQAKTYDSVYVFGDSLSDNGNLATALGMDLPSPPYFQNRVTNGRVAVEVMSSHLGLQLKPSYYFLGQEYGGNYAVAGASASEEDPIPAPENLTTQVGSFLALNLWNAPADALYVVFIGGNDVRAARGVLNPLDPTDTAAATAILDEATATIGGAVAELIKFGAQHIMVVNAPNIGAIPETMIAAQAYGIDWLPAVTQGLTTYFNDKLTATLNFVELTTAKPVMRFDLYNTVNMLLFSAESLGISNTTEPCYLTYGNETMPVLNPSCVDENLEPAPNTFFFIDEIHPTKNVHKAIGKAMATQLKFGAM